MINQTDDKSRAPAPTSEPGARDAVAEYKVGTWFDARTVDEMQAFYLSRLPTIREAAREHGYAIGLHGSTRRDFDLIAMPWRDNASDKDSLARAIADAACGIRREGAYDWEAKPSGRFAVSIPICWTDHANHDFDNMISAGHIDLSVIATPASPAVLAAPLAPSAVAFDRPFDPKDETIKRLQGLVAAYEQIMERSNRRDAISTRFANSADPAPLVAQASPEPTLPLCPTENEMQNYLAAKTSFDERMKCTATRVVLERTGHLAPEASPLVEDAQRIVAGKVEGCGCRKCNPEKVGQWFFVCIHCGNKRCPHANDHRNDCTGSNEPGQKGSAYELQGHATTSNITAAGVDPGEVQTIRDRIANTAGLGTAADGKDK